MAFELRRYSTAGMAMATAGVIAISPLSIPPPDLHLPAPTTVASTRTVDLTAFVNPIAAWGDVLTTTITDIGNLGQMYAADPFPIVRQIVANQVGYAKQIISIGEQMGNGLVRWANQVPAQLQTALQQLASGQFAAGVDGLYAIPLTALVSVMFPLLQFDVPKKIAQNVTNVIGSLSSVVAQVALGGLGVLYAGEQAFANTGQEFLDAVKAGDAATAFSAVINFPATMANALLNGYGVSKGTSGIFGSYGFVASVIRALKVVADAIKPPVPEAPVAATVDGPAAIPASATKALAPVAKVAATAAVEAGSAVKESSTPEKVKATVTKEDPKPATAVATEAETPKAEPVKVETSIPAADPVSAEPAKVETTKPVTKDTKSEPETKATGTTSSDADSAGKPDKSDKPAGKGQKAEKAPKAQKTPKAPKVAKQPKKASSSTQQSANAG